ncbi:MAG: glycogen synthase GlgA [Clostridiaceae bacterium]
MKVLFIASECHPFIKTGGLGDVAYALPKALRKLGIDVRVILPKYSMIDDYFKNQMRHIASFGVQVGWREQYCGLQYLEFDGIPFYFVDNEYYFKRGDTYGFYDDGERFSYFSKAVLESITYMGDFTPNILHCNDWQTAIIPVLLRDHYRYYSFYNNMKTVFTIHNLRFQGVFPKTVLSELLNLDNGYFHESALKYHDAVNFVKGALTYSNKISTVSNTYAHEIQTKFFGEGLHGLLKDRKHDLWGIVNGIDYDTVNPATDHNLPFKFDLGCLHNKTSNKIDLQRQLGLPQNSDVPMIGIVSRLTDQKGFDLIESVMDDLMRENIQLVVLGTGDKKFENMFKHYAWKYPHKVSAHITFNNNLAQRIYAASDMFLMPSQFEPCGLSQLIALRYGSIPIVRETGGLRDTVFSYNESTNEGNGFTFANYNSHDMLYTIRRAIHFYWDKYHWYKLIHNAMCSYNSWDRSADLYVKLYYSMF